VLAALDLDAPRAADAALPPERERATTLVIHVDRADMRMATDAVVHVGAAQLASLVQAGPDAGGVV
jgi:hypothetical protein